MQQKGTWIALAVLAIAAVGVGAFFAGRSNGESRGEDKYKSGSADYQAIYDKGEAAGEDKYKPGSADYQAIYDKGKSAGQASGEKSGQEKGQKLGLEKGEQQGKVTGANDVFNAFSSWEVGGLYIVQIGQGSGGVDYVIASRKQMEEGNDYKLCVDDPSSVCVVTKG